MNHPTDEVLVRYARCELRADDTIEPNHVIGCQQCTDRLAELDLAPVPPSARTTDNVGDVTLSDDELRAIVDEAREWNNQLVTWNVRLAHLRIPLLSADERSYIEGVVAERKRARAEAATVRALAVKLATQLQSMQHRQHCRDANREMRDALSSLPLEERSPGDSVYRCQCGLTALVDECRAAGLLSSESEE